MTEVKDDSADLPDMKTAGVSEEDAAKPEKKDRRAGAVRALKDKLGKAEGEIERLEKELADLNDRHLRRLAEIENLRKRHDKERADYVQFALSDFLLELLAILDNFERALAMAKDTESGQSFREGVELIYRMYHQLLVKKGIRPVSVSDGRFNPEIHHAMSTEESDQVDEPLVGEELQKGYYLHDRLLRPALVKVLIPRKG